MGVQDTRFGFGTVGRRATISDIATGTAMPGPLIKGKGPRLRRAVVACVLLVGLVPVVDVSGVAAQAPADGCVRELGALDATTAVAQGSGIIAVDAGCVSSARGPAGTSGTFYARRHVFTLDTAATVSVRVDDANSSRLRTYAVLLAGRSADGSGTVVGRADSSRAFGGSANPAYLDHLLLQAGTYTIEATTTYAGDTGDYEVRVERWPADGCVRELGALDATTAVAQGSGIIAVDAGCVSSARGPAGTSGTFYARRHVFTLDTAATVSVRVDDANSSRLRTYAVLLAGRSADGSGTVVGRADSSRAFGGSANPAYLDHLLLQAGTYTIEATTTYAGDTGDYEVRVERWPADGCVRELGALDATTAVAQGSGIIAVDAGCVSSARGPAGTSGTFYARRHVFTLDTAATVSVRVDDANSSRLRTYAVLLAGRSADGSGTVVGRADSSRAFGGSANPAYLDHLLLQAGTYTIEATTTYAGDTGDYEVRVERWPADGCVRELGALDATTAVAQGSGIIAVDAGCVSSARGPAGTSGTFYARRHVFTLDTAATVSVRVDDANSSRLRTYAVLLAGRSADGSGTVVGRADSSRAFGGSANPAYLDHLLLQAGTYTIEATTTYAGDTGDYEVRVERWPADGCVRELSAVRASS